MMSDSTNTLVTMSDSPAAEDIQLFVGALCRTRGKAFGTLVIITGTMSQQVEGETEHLYFGRKIPSGPIETHRSYYPNGRRTKYESSSEEDIIKVIGDVRRLGLLLEVEKKLLEAESRNDQLNIVVKYMTDAFLMILRGEGAPKVGFFGKTFNNVMNWAQRIASDSLSFRDRILKGDWP